MTLLEVLIFVFSCAAISGVRDWRQAQKRIDYFRAQDEKRCEYLKTKYPEDWQNKTNFCESPRYSYPRQWWETRTYAELLTDMENEIK